MRLSKGLRAGLVALTALVGISASTAAMADSGKIHIRIVKAGFVIGGSGGNTIGGTAAGTGNVIAANGTNGVWVNGQSKITISGIVYDTDGKTGGNVFQGNSIGVNASGAILSNGNDGMYLLQPGQIQIGGTAAGARNIIAGKTANGTYADGSTNTGTSMSDTGGWSIEVVGAPNLTLTNNTLLTVTASVDTTAHTITVGSQKGNTVYTLIN